MSTSRSRAVAAIEPLFKTVGGNAQRAAARQPHRARLRDAPAGSVHVANDVERALAMYGRSAFGLTVEDNLAEGRSGPGNASCVACRRPGNPNA